MFTDVVSELVELTEAELDDEIRELELERRRVEARLAASVAVAEGRALNEADGHRSMAGYLKATCNWGGGEAARFVGVARTVDRHPEIGDGWLAGRFGLGQVVELSRTRARRAGRERFGEFVPQFVVNAEELSHADFKRTLERFLVLADADGTIAERDAVEGRSATVDEVGGELVLHAAGGDALSVAEFVGIMRRFEQAEFTKDLASRDAAIAAGEDPEPFRTGPQRRFDALLQMARVAASAPEGQAIVGSAPLVSVLLDQRTMSWILVHSGLGSTTNLAGESVDPFTGLPITDGELDELLADLLGDPGSFADRRCETADGSMLRPADVLRAVLSGRTRRVVLGADSRVIDLGRSSRLFTGAAREAATLLATTCSHPGCDLPADWCQVDHSTEWHELGVTDQDNADVRCAAHNRDKHRRRRRTRRTTIGRVHTVRADGSIMLPVGVRPPRLDAGADDEPDDSDELVDDAPESPADRRRIDEIIRARAALLRPAGA